METTVRATCPQCRSALRIPTHFLGQMVRCKKCGAVVRTKPRAANGAGPVPVVAPPPLPATQSQAYPVPVPALLPLDFAPPQSRPPPAASPYPAPPAYPQAPYAYPPAPPVNTPEFQPSEKTVAYRGGRYGKTSP